MPVTAALESSKKTSRVGTPCYLAPEILFSDSYDEAVDVWGLGCIMFEVVSLDFLWERKGMLGAAVRETPLTMADINGNVSIPARHRES